MKTKRKSLLLVLCAALLVTASVFGTMAYLTSQDEVVNTFTVGDVAITLDEADVDDSTADAARDQANKYHLLPGHEYVKDPTVHVSTDSENCWIFVKVTNGIADIEAKTTETMDDGSDYATIAEQMSANGWAVVEGTTDVYAYKDIVSADTDVVVFEEFMISGTVDSDTLADYADKNITVTAYAIQADGFETAADAWAAAGSSFAE